MALRLIDITCSAPSGDKVTAAVDAHEHQGEWLETLDDGRRRMRVLIHAHNSEKLLDDLETLLGSSDLDFQAALMSVEASLPRHEEKKSWLGIKLGRVAREELYAKLREGTEVSFLFLAQVVLSAIVAAIGLVRNDVAVLIGAMVIAPLLTPNVSLTLGTTLGDWSYAWKALRVNLTGVVLAFLLAVGMGLIVKADPKLPSLAARTQVNQTDVALALAAGSAGALAFTAGAPASLVGVMVAVALMPPLVAAGLLLAGGHHTLSLGALELVAVNVICVNLCGVATFLLQGVGPRTWWEEERAKKLAQAALCVWLLLLAGILTLIAFTSRR